jgi:hypothetical protein
MVNRLAFAQSLYLRKHAENPIDWWSWSEEALNTAKAQNKPIFLSIGYSSCHWKKGLLSGISLGLELKFGTEGLQLMPEIQALDSLETLEAILKAIKTVKTLDELRQVYRH